MINPDGWRDLLARSKGIINPVLFYLFLINLQQLIAELVQLFFQNKEVMFGCIQSEAHWDCILIAKFHYPVRHPHCFRIHQNKTGIRSHHQCMQGKRFIFGDFDKGIKIPSGTKGISAGFEYSELPAVFWQLRTDVIPSSCALLNLKLFSSLY